MKDTTFILCLFIAFAIFFAFRVGYGLGVKSQVDKKCSPAQCMSERLKGEESCWKYKK